MIHCKYILSTLNLSILVENFEISQIFSILVTAYLIFNCKTWPVYYETNFFPSIATGKMQQFFSAQALMISRYQFFMNYLNRSLMTNTASEVLDIITSISQSTYTQGLRTHEDELSR